MGNSSDKPDTPDSPDSPDNPDKPDKPLEQPNEKKDSSTNTSNSYYTERDANYKAHLSELKQISLQMQSANSKYTAISKCMYIFVVVLFCLACFKLHMQVKQMERDTAEKNAEGVFISKERWINVCKIELYEYIETNLYILKSNAAELKDPIKELYTTESFLAENHDDLLTHIDYLKTVRDISGKFDGMGVGSVGSLREADDYWKTQSIQGLLAKLDQLVKKKISYSE